MKISARKLFILCLIFAAPLPWMISIGGLAGIYPYEIIIFICLLVIWFKRLFYSSKKQLVRQSNIDPIIRSGLLFVTFVFIGSIINVTRDLFYNKVEIVVLFKIILHVTITILILMGAFLGGFIFFRGEKDLLKISWILFIAFFLTAMQTLIEWLITTGGVISRYNFDPPSGLGQGDTARTIILGFFIAIFLLINVRDIRKKLFLVFALIIFSISILSIQSRAAYVVFFIQLLVFVLLVLKPLNNSTWKYTRLFLILIVCVVSYFSKNLILNTELSQSIQESVLDVNSNESLNKLVVINEGINFFLNNPLFGIGWGQFGLKTSAEMVVSGTGYKVASPHNGMIQLLSETGLLGALTALWIYYVILKYLSTQYKSKQDSKVKQFFGILLLLFIIVIISQFVVSSYLFPPPAQRNSVRFPFYHWFLLGYAYSFMKENHATC